jgi:hypothetical protein
MLLCPYCTEIIDDNATCQSFENSFTSVPFCTQRGRENKKRFYGLFTDDAFYPVNGDHTFPERGRFIESSPYRPKETVRVLKEKSS